MSAIAVRVPSHDIAPGRPSDEPTWTFLTNHAHVLICLAGDPDLRLRDVADLVGITERAAQRIVADLVDAGYLERARTGRRNTYRLRLERPMRHPLEADNPVDMLVQALTVHAG
jgi:hypothetical protein